MFAVGIGLAEAVKHTLVLRNAQLAGVEVTETGPGTVNLSGILASFYLRQLAVSIASHVAGVRFVSDGIQVAVVEPKHTRKIKRSICA